MTWIEIFPEGGTTSHNWGAVSISKDGSSMMAGINWFGRLYRYCNGTWSETQPMGNNDGLYYGFTMSSNGSVILTGQGVEHGAVYKYSNGVWATENAGATKPWSAFALSSIGSKMFVGSTPDDYGNGYAYLKNYGVWTSQWPAGNNVNKSWTKAAMSADGSKILVIGAVFNDYTSAKLYLFNGTSWSWVNPPGASEYTDWMSVAMSDDGSVMYAGCNSTMYKYSGGSWSQLSPTPGYSCQVKSIATNTDGSKVLALGRDNAYLYQNGAWTEVYPAGTGARTNDEWFNQTAMSGDGSKILVSGTGTATGKKGLYLGSHSITDSITQTTVKIYGRITNIGSASATVRGICYGLSANPVITGPHTTTNGTFGTGIFSDKITGLTPATIYHARAYAANSSGTSYGSDITFTTNPVFPAQITIAAGSLLRYDSVSLTGNITDIGGDSCTKRGMIYYTYNGTDKTLKSSGVINISEIGLFGTGVWTDTVKGLSINTRYSARSFAVNLADTAYSARLNFYTAAKVPSAPTVSTPTTTSLKVTININNNPSSTYFAIQDSATGKYVQSTGILVDTAVWQTSTSWGQKVVTGLTTGITYYFRVKARNGDGVATAFGPTASGMPVGPPTVTVAVDSLTSLSALMIGNITSVNGVNATSRGFIYYPYSNTDKIIGDAGVISKNQTGNWTAGEYNDTLKGLTCNTRYNSRADAINTWGTGYSPRTDFWTLANVPSAPTVSNPQLTSLDVTINVNSNPSATQFAIQVLYNTTTKFVRANGTLGDTAVWQTAATWGTKTITGLLNGITHFFNVKARNGGGIETAPGEGTIGIPVDDPTVQTHDTIPVWANGLNPTSDNTPDWQSVAVSEDGKKMISTCFNDSVYISVDAGKTWYATSPTGIKETRDWTFVTMSADGQKMIVVTNAGLIFASVTGGDTWYPVYPLGIANTRRWDHPSVSPDGSVWLVSVTTGVDPRPLYKSTNNGTTWTEIKSTSSWGFVTSASNSGSVIIAGERNGGQSARSGKLFKSVNGGISWTELMPADSSVNLYWSSVSISANGETILASVYNGRLFKSTDSGISWTEERPAGNLSKNWYSVAVSDDGNTMMAAVPSERLYRYSANTWSEIKPAGNNDKYWYSVDLSGDGTTMLTVERYGLLYHANPGAVSNITSASATGHGMILKNNGANIIKRGIIWYPYSSTDKIIGEANVTNVEITGSISPGTFSDNLTGLSINSHYNLRAHATNSGGTGYGGREEFWTLAAIPGCPSLVKPQTTSLEIIMDGNGNPAITKFSIQVLFSSVTKFVRSTGTLGDTAVWQTEAAWEVNDSSRAKTITGLSANTLYKLKVKAKNGADSVTIYSPADSLFTLANVPSAPGVGSPSTSSLNVSINSNGNPAITTYAIEDSISGKYIQSNGTLGVAAVWKTEVQWETASANTALTVTGLSSNTRYAFRIRARNGNLTETNFSPAFYRNTAAIVPSPPNVFHPAANSLDISLNSNGNNAATEYAIHDSVNALYIQANGTRAADAIWQTAAGWDTVTVTGLTTGTWYYHRVKARNGDLMETAFSVTKKAITCADPSDAGTIGTPQEICFGNTPDALSNLVGASNFGGTLRYKWQKSILCDTSGFTDISGADTAGYAPGILTTSTWFRRLASVTCKPDWSTAAVSAVVKITVDPITVGGYVDGDTLVCYGSHTSVLTLSGHTGSVLKWQYAVNGTDWLDVPNTTTTNIVTDLVVDTWYRAVVKSGVCLTENSASHKIKVFANYKISGTAKYYNNPQTPLNGLKIILSRKLPGSSWQKKDSVVTGFMGNYEFSGLTNAQYSITVKSAHPSGQWQTWGGVNNTDAAMVLNHINNSQPLLVNPPVVRITADVKTPHPAIDNTDYLMIRQAAKSGWGYFDIPKWVFSGLDFTTRIDTFQMNCYNMTRDIRGLCAGDINGSWLPASGYKTLEPGLELISDGVIPIADEMVFPVRLSQSAEIGAITLYLDYDPFKIEITGVTMPGEPREPLVWNLNLENKGVLYIGWVSTETIRAGSNEIILMVHARLKSQSSGSGMTAPDQSSQIVQFTLNTSPLSELADGKGAVINGARLTIPVSARENETTGKPGYGKMEITSIFPNPAIDVVNVKILSESWDLANIELYNLIGKVINTDSSFTLHPGLNHIRLYAGNLLPGIYLMKASSGAETTVRKVVIKR